MIDCEQQVAAMKNFNIKDWDMLRIMFVTLIVSISGCTSSLNLKVESEIPTPLFNQLPLNMGVYYDEQFRTYTYTEDSSERPNWSIDSGASQVAMFDQVLPSMFKTVTQISEPLNPGNSYNVDGILAPSIEEMQFSLPAETKMDLYEVWIKYKIGLYDNSGQHIIDIPLIAYGKTSTEFLKTRDKALQAAMDLALRDGGARMALGFLKDDGVKQWLTMMGLCGGETSVDC
jgi:hypothetical protein